MSSGTENFIDEALATFSQGGVSITVGACDQNRRPCQVRGAGCRISRDRDRITIFVSAQQGAAVLDCLRNESAITVVFSQPTTHRTFQVKGERAQIAPLASGDEEIMANYRKAFAQEVKPLGFDEPLIQTLFAFPATDILSLTFAPVEAFLQTPGPNAGAKIMGNK